MKIRLAQSAGFCFGVKRAIDIGLDTVQANPDRNVATYGPIINNQHVVAKLKSNGLSVVEDLADFDNGVLVIRSHGVAPDVVERLKDSTIDIVDATCPFVRKAQKYAEFLSENGYTVFIIGDKGHPEVTGLLGYTRGMGYVLGEPGDVDLVACVEKAAIISQTTQTLDNLTKTVTALLSKTKELRIFNTICTATAARQRAALELAAESEVMIIVGSRSSANTTRLTDLCRQAGVKTYHIETAEELRESFFEGVENIGVSAGASTPDWIIEEVVDKMTEMTKPEQNEDIQVEVDREDEVVSPESQESVDSDSNSSQATDEVEEETFEAIVGAEKDLLPIAQGQIIIGQVVKVDEDGVLVDIGHKFEGIIPKSQVSIDPKKSIADVVKVGDSVKVLVERIEDEEGKVILSKKKADTSSAWENLQLALDSDQVIEGTVTDVVKGGLLVDLGVRGFIPASHVSREYVENLQEFIGKTVRLKVIEVDKKKNNVVLSRRQVLEEEYEGVKAKIFESLQEGQIVKGTIKRITSFGAFVDIGSGVEGLLHVSEMAWSRVAYPQDLVSEGDVVDVMVLSVNPENERIALGLKQTKKDPWESVATRYVVDDIVTGIVTKLVDFGAFVKLEDGVEGLIHISQLARRRVEKPSEVVSIGQEVSVKIINVNADDRRIGLSLKELEEEVDRTEESQVEFQNTRNKDDEDDMVTIGDLVGGIFNNHK